MARDLWDRAERIVTMAGVVAVPLVLAFYGNRWQHAMVEQQVQKDYVQIAVSILSTRPISKDDPLRPWAVEVINSSSPVRLTLEQERALGLGQYVRGEASPVADESPLISDRKAADDSGGMERQVPDRD